MAQLKKINNENWIYEKENLEKINQALDWANQNQAKITNVDLFAEQYDK